MPAMNRKPNYGPDDPETAAQNLADELLHLSREILTRSTRPEIPELGQLILRRGKLLEDLTLLTPENLSPAAQQNLHRTLSACRKMDETIERNLSTFRTDLDDQLRGCRDSRALLDKYRVPEQGMLGTRSEDA